MTNEIIETLFDSFLETTQTGELSETLHTVSAALDEQIEAGAVDEAIELTGDYELAAFRLAFYAGFAAALELHEV